MTALGDFEEDDAPPAWWHYRDRGDGTCMWCGRTWGGHAASRCFSPDRSIGCGEPEEWRPFKPDRQLELFA